MRYEIIVGINEEEAKIPCIHTNLWMRGNISESSTFYLLHNDLIPIRVYVYKDSEEGRHITEWIKNEGNRNNESVMEKALEFIVPRLTVDEFKTVIGNKEKSSYHEGYQQAQADMRKVLGLTR